MPDKPPAYWVFSNKPEGHYDNNFWDQATVLETCRYSIKEPERNRKRVQPGDMVYMRIYSQSYMGKFRIAGAWQPLPKKEQAWKHPSGWFPMDDMEIWQRPVPQGLIIREMSNGDIRSRIVSITHDDTVKIETAQRIYARLGFGGADDEIVVLEKGLEEAIKPNLKKLGLKLADEKIRQQFSMGPGVGRSDLICANGEGDLVVIEMKRGMTSDEAIGQVLRYVGWVQENIAKEGQKIHGWIVAGDYDEHLRLAAMAAKVKLVLVRLG